ncbi:MAG: hypothetical protein ACE5G0_08145 [Rhodothermales bacterium]
MQSPIERRLDAYLARIINKIRHLRQLDLAQEGACEEALDESLEVLRSLTMYRGMLKNVGEHHFAVSKGPSKRGERAQVHPASRNFAVSKGSSKPPVNEG